MLRSVIIAMVTTGLLLPTIGAQEQNPNDLVGGCF